MRGGLSAYDSTTEGDPLQAEKQNGSFKVRCWNKKLKARCRERFVLIYEASKARRIIKRTNILICSHPSTAVLRYCHLETAVLRPAALPYNPSQLPFGTTLRHFPIRPTAEEVGAHHRARRADQFGINTLSMTLITPFD